jgi:ATP-dependent Lon protease
MALFKKTPEQDQRIDSGPAELHSIRQTLAEIELPEAARRVADKELERLAKTDPSLAEFTIGMNYLELIIDLPWLKRSPNTLDIHHAEALLDREHHGLNQVKERILEYLASTIIFTSKSFTILVVDDEEIARENIVHALSKQNNRVIAATNGQEALALLAENEVQLIITDLKMDKLDGMQLLGEVKHAYPEVEIILVTGYATVDTAVDAFKGGATNYLPKPLNLDTLRRTVAEVKERHHQVRMTGPILCFTGPPGTGKTSIGRGVAEAMNRKFIRLSMAGLRDEAELRGHRRTYVGSMPGRIINEIRRVGVNNPVFMLDEIDKIGQDFRGDPASVLLEVLDPEQNRGFLDYYLDIPFDLSDVLFITTANIPESLPRPLLDRMEMIPFPSYSLAEKRWIGLSHLFPKQLRQHGQSENEITITEAAMTRLIRDYTRGAGLRGLERELGALCRKVNRLVLKGERTPPLPIDETDIRTLLGPSRYVREAAQADNLVGVTTGLAWTEGGGQIMFIETAKMRGTGQLILTGSLGDVLKESAQTALSYVRSRATVFGVDDALFEQTDIHVHIPAGSIQKDGPSAGLTIALALISLLTGRPARRDVAMSGELSLSGRVLPISGMREKILAAQEAGVRLAIFPKQNEPALASLGTEVREAVELRFFESVEPTLELVLEPPY